MAITAADLQVKLSTTGADSVKRDLQGIGTAVDDAGSKGRTFGQTMRTALMFGAAGTVIGAGAGIVALGKQWVMGASNLAEAQSKVNVVYGQSANVINKWAKTTAKAFGITETSALDTAGTMGNLFTTMGIGKDTAADMSMQVTELSADMASFNNVSQPQVIDALTSAFVGEYDALQRLGVPISAAAVEQYALNEGIWDGVGAMTEAERATAVYGFTMENTANQQGDVARTSGEMANQLRFLSAGFQELGVKIGTAFLPAANAMVGWAIDAVDWVSRLVDTFGAGGFGAVVDSITADLAGLSIDVADWTANVGAPAVIDFTWDAAAAIAGFLTNITVSLTGWTASLDGAEIVAGTLDLAGEIGEFVANNPMVVPIAAAALTLMFVGAPGILLVGLTAGIIALAAQDQIPDEVAIPAAQLTIAFIDFTIELSALSVELGLAVAAAAEGLTAQIPLLALEILNYDIALLDLPAAIAMAVVAEVGDYSLGGVTLGLEIASFTISLFGLAAAIVDEVQASLEGAGASLPMLDLEIGGIDVDLGLVNVANVLKNAVLDSTGAGVVIEMLDVTIAGLNITIPSDVAAGALESALNAALPGSSILIDLLDIGGDDNGGDGDPESFFTNIESGFARVVVAANTARDAIGGVFGGGAGGDGGRGAGGGSAGPVLGTITAVQTALTSLIAFAQQATSAMTSGMAQMRAAVTAGMAGVTSAVVSGMATSRAAAVSGIASMVASMVAGMAAFRAAVTSGMAGAVAAVRSGIAAMVAAASAGRGQMMSAGLGIGAALGQGIAAGIRGQIGAVAAAAAALVSAAVSAARSAGAINSPSRVMQEQVGQMLGLGAAIGVEDMYPRMDAAMAGLVRVPTAPLIAGGGLNQGGGGGIVINFNGSFNGSFNRDQMNQWAAEDLIPMIVRRDQQRKVALGVAS